MASGRIIETEPVREFTGDTTRLTRSVLRDLEARRADLVEQLARIRCATFEDYTERHGRIEGLDIAISICKEIQAKLQA